MTTSVPKARKGRPAVRRSSGSAHPGLIVDGNPGKEAIGETVAMLLAWAMKRGQAVAVAPALQPAAAELGLPESKHLIRFDTPDGLAARFESVGAEGGLIICLGGDGALLHSVGGYRGLDLPFLGVNLGSVGFNASVLPDRLTETLEGWEAGETQEIELMLLSAGLIRDGAEVQRGIALNELVLRRQPRSRMLEIELSQGEERILAFHADGLIVSTPTGSTAYSLSAGGPIVHPAVSAFVVVGLEAHTLSSRPVLLPLEPALTLRSRGGREPNEADVALDGQTFWSLRGGDEIVIEAAARPIRLVKPKGAHYFDTVRQKLNWNVPIKPLESE